MARKRVEEDEHDDDRKPQATPPVRMDEVRPVDLIGCPECGVVLHLHGREDLETIEGGMFAADVEGIFCPVCKTMLFDKKSWIRHLAERLSYDRELAKGAAAEGKVGGAEQGAREAA